jgi:divalent anion:Na+ symporter, DASS family
MPSGSDSTSTVGVATVDLTREQIAARRRHQFLLWIPVFVALAGILLLPRPAGITPEAWRLLAVFAATIAGLIFQPLPVGAMVLLGIAAIAASGAAPVAQALAGWSEPAVWMVLAAFSISRGMIKTGLGRRIAFLFIRAIGHTSLGLSYALVATDFVLGAIIPSNSARAGGIVFPIAKSIAETYESHPGPTAGRLGAYLMPLIYQCDVIICAMFLTGQASNALIARFANQVTGLELSYPMWALGAIVPGLGCLAVVPRLLYKINPPEVTHTPGASVFASEELRRMGPMSGSERLMLSIFGFVTIMWSTIPWHGIDYSVIALGAVGVLLITNVLTWEDVLNERAGWDVFVWYGGVFQMAKLLGDSGVTKVFAEFAARMTAGWEWGAALAALVLIYFYAHYVFASITAHAAAMYIPFLTVILAAGAPPWIAVLTLSYFSNLDASLTHYGTTPAPIYFGAGYVSQRTWWKLGFLVSIPNIIIFATLGFLWWKILGWW